MAHRYGVLRGWMSVCVMLKRTRAEEEGEESCRIQERA